MRRNRRGGSRVEGKVKEICIKKGDIRSRNATVQCAEGAEGQADLSGPLINHGGTRQTQDR